MSREFHIPVLRGEIFEPETEARLAAAFPDLGQAGVLEFQLYLVGQDGERAIADKAWGFNGLPNPDPDAREAAEMRISHAWGLDRLAEQTITAMPYPWDHPILGPRMAGKLVSIFWRPGLAIIGQEYIATFLEDDATDPLGPDRPAEERCCVAAIVLAPAESRHAEIAQRKKLDFRDGDLDLLWEAFLSEMAGELVPRLSGPFDPAGPNFAPIET